MIIAGKQLSSTYTSNLDICIAQKNEIIQHMLYLLMSYSEAFLVKIICPHESSWHYLLSIILILEQWRLLGLIYFDV